MNEKTFNKRLAKMQKYIYNEIFLKNNNLEDTLRESLRHSMRYVFFANIRFTLVFNCLIKAEKEKLFKEDIENPLRTVREICAYLDIILEKFLDIYSKQK